jgi:small subunit ribosomal protein S1
VKNLTSYGLFVELEEGIDGLVHVSDLSWNKKIKHPAEFTKKGEKLEVVVLEVDTQNRRLSLGHKQLEENPWDTFESIFSVGSVHEGTVTSVNEKGATVQLPYGVEAFAPTRHIKKKDNTSAREDDVLEFEVIEFSKDQKRIIASHTNIWKGAEKAKGAADEASRDKMRKTASKTIKKINKSSEKTTLGELEALSELRARMERAERSDAPAAKVTKETPAAEEKKAKKAESIADDLKKIAGIGPAFEKRLQALGVHTLSDMAALSDERIAEMEAEDSMTSLEQWHKWIEEAKGLI